MQPIGMQTKRNIYTETRQQEKEGEEAMNKNREGYPDGAAGEAIRAAGRMPKHIHDIYKAVNTVLDIHGLEIIGLRDKRTKREWRK